MSFNTILSATKIDPGNRDTQSGLNGAITSLSNGSFAVSYVVIDDVDPIPVVFQVNGQGQLVQEPFGPHLPTPSSDFASDIAALSGGGLALACLAGVGLVIRVAG
jgi:hypothetical protein